jgi:hypothetical protein
VSPSILCISICNAEIVTFIFNPHLHAVTGASKISHIVCHVYTFYRYFLVVYKLFSDGTFNGIQVTHTTRKDELKTLDFRLGNRTEHFVVYIFRRNNKYI